MRSRYPIHWRQWAGRRARPGAGGVVGLLRSRIFQMVAMMTLVALAVAAAVVVGAPLGDLGDLDAWEFWLREAGSAREAAGAVLLGRGPTLTLGLINRPSAENVRVAVDGRTVADFSTWKVELRVSEGDTISAEAAAGADPVRIRVIATRGVTTPSLGSEWSVIAGEKVLGSVTVRE